MYLLLYMFSNANGLVVVSIVETCQEFKNQVLQKITFPFSQNSALSMGTVDKFERIFSKFQKSE